MPPTPDDAVVDRKSRLETKQNGISLSRSPKPYRRRGLSLRQNEASSSSSDLDALRRGAKSDSSDHDHAIEADDEKGLLKTLPAPPLRARKGLRGGNTPLDLTPAISPLPTPGQEQSSFDFTQSKPSQEDQPVPQDIAAQKELRAKYERRRNAEIVRRTVECLILGGIALQTVQRPGAWNTLSYWSTEALLFLLTVCTIYTFYPLRRAWNAWRRGWLIQPAMRYGFHIPSRFDVGPLLYPPFLPTMLALSLETENSSMLLANMVLGLASIPPRIVPFQTHAFSYLHWTLSLIPPSAYIFTMTSPPTSRIGPGETVPVLERMSFLYPLHFTLANLVHYLTTTSLDPAEIQLLASGLSNLLIYSSNPQAQILKALLWVGGATLLALCDKVLCWEVALARIPAWKFARNKPSRAGLGGRINRILRAILPEPRTRFASSSEQSDSEDDVKIANPKLRRVTPHVKGLRGDDDAPLTRTTSATEKHTNGSAFGPRDLPALARSTTFSTFGRAATIAVKWRRLAASSSPFMRLTYLQAQALKILIALFVYATFLAIVLVPVRYFVSHRALNGAEPFGWAVGYLAGDLQPLRMFVVSNRLDFWIKLPLHKNQVTKPEVFGWVEDMRQRAIGAANSRLLLAAYCILTIVAGLVAVLQLQRVVEVDTRRKVFHGVMVVMLLPTIPVDPCFFALALVVMLGVFLILDVFRASQLPPVSKPLTRFLAPYVDGRDHRGPVVVSHIFLLVGCAIPLWLSLANTARSGTGPSSGWEVPERDVSLISGVVCVGMGDAAASLIGRRYGRTKWSWGGGKSIEGSAAFAVAVTIGLTTSYLWLRLGGWVAWEPADVPWAVLKAAIAGSGASMMESTLTAANDNVVVPIGLWLIVRGLNI